MTMFQAMMRFKSIKRPDGKPVRSDRAAALVGYCYIIRTSGWGAISLNDANKSRLRRDFERAGVNPFEVDIDAGEAERITALMDDEGRNHVAREVSTYTR